MSTKGREVNTKEKRGISPSLPRKTEIGQQRRSPNPPSILERKKAFSAQNSKKPPSLDKIKPPRKSLDKPALSSKVTAIRSKFTERNVISSSKTTSSTKPKDVGKSHPPLRPLQRKNSVNVKKTLSTQPTKEKKSSSSSDHEDNKTVIYENVDKLILNDDVKQKLDNYDDDFLHGEVEFEEGDGIAIGKCFDHIILKGDEYTSEFEICSRDYVTIDRNESTNDLDNESKQRDQVEETCDIKENEELENVQVLEMTENVEEVALLSKDVEPIYSEQLAIPKAEDKDQENEPKEPKIEECDANIPKIEEPTLSNVVVKNKHGTSFGKKDTTVYNDVIEETVIKLREQRKNRVRALVGAFETVISLESDAPKE